MLTMTTLTSLALHVDTVNMIGPRQPASRRTTTANLREALVDAGARAGARPAARTPSCCARSPAQPGVSHNAAYRHFADHDDLLRRGRRAVHDRAGRR